METKIVETNYKEIEKLVVGVVFGKEYISTLSVNDFARNDFKLEINGIVVIGEIKERNFNSTDFRNEGWILEKSKLDALAELKNKEINKSYIVYINYFNKDNTIVVWNLGKVNRKEVVVKEMNKTTNSNFRYSGVKTNKEVFFLKLENAYKVIKC